MLLATELFFELDGVMVDPELGGAQISAERDGIKLALFLPRSADEFKFAHVGAARVAGSSVDPRDYDPQVACVEHGSQVREVRVVRVVATIEVADEWDPTGEDAMRWRLMSASEQFARDFCDWVRMIGGQPFMTPPGGRPQLVSAARLLRVIRDVEAEAFPSTDVEAEAFPSMIAPGGRIHVLDSESVLGQESLRAVERAIRRGSPDPEQRLLADALHDVGDSPANDPARAVLLAAIAVEVKLRRAVRVSVSDQQRELVDLLLENPRDWSLSVHALFAKVIPAVRGETPDAKWPEMAKIVKKLFEARNAVAHKGKPILAEDAQRLVTGAREVFALLSELETNVTSATDDESDRADTTSR